MVEPIVWLRVFIDNYNYLEYLIIFLGVAFGGELILLALGFLAAHNVIAVLPLIIFSFLGTLSSDVLWFFLGRTAFIRKLIAHRYANNTVSVINETIKRISKDDDLTTLIIAKFLVGTRVLLIMFIGTKVIKFKDFFRYDILAVCSWISIIIPIGFISGLGFTYFSSILENIYAAIGFVLLIILLAIMFQIWFKRRFTESSGDVI